VLTTAPQTVTEDDEIDEHERIARFEAVFLAAAAAWKVEAAYVWRRLKPMVARYSAVGVAKRQVMKAGISPGFRRLQEAGRLDLSIEALVLRPEHSALFSREERDAARRRLAAHGFGVSR